LCFSEQIDFMNIAASTFIFILVSVGMSAVAQVLLKTGMSKGEIGLSLAQQHWTSSVMLVATNPWVIGGLVMYFLSAAVWLLVLARVQLSFAYPFVGLGFILTMFLGWWLMGDSIGLQRVAGTVLIAVGVVLIARGG
jgi:drug/metabolite transporter (DMT)-like permease